MDTPRRDERVRMSAPVQGWLPPWPGGLCPPRPPSVLTVDTATSEAAAAEPQGFVGHQDTPLPHQGEWSDRLTVSCAGGGGGGSAVGSALGSEVYGGSDSESLATDGPTWRAPPPFRPLFQLSTVARLEGRGLTVSTCAEEEGEGGGATSSTSPSSPSARTRGRSGRSGPDADHSVSPLPLPVLDAAAHDERGGRACLPRHSPTLGVTELPWARGALETASRHPTREDAGGNESTSEGSADVLLAAGDASSLDRGRVRAHGTPVHADRIISVDTGSYDDAEAHGVHAQRATVLTSRGEAAWRPDGRGARGDGDPRGGAAPCPSLAALSGGSAPGRKRVQWASRVTVIQPDARLEAVEHSSHAVLSQLRSVASAPGANARARATAFFSTAVELFHGAGQPMPGRVGDAVPSATSGWVSPLLSVPGLVTASRAYLPAEWWRTAHGVLPALAATTAAMFAHHRVPMRDIWADMADEVEGCLAEEAEDARLESLAQAVSRAEARGER